MPVPKTAVHKENFSSGGKNEIGLTLKVGAVKSVPITHTMNKTANHHFRSRILAPNGPHDIAAGFRRLLYHVLLMAVRLDSFIKASPLLILVFLTISEP